MQLVAVAAIAENGVIGQDGEVPWTLPEDRRQYRARVADSPVILGRKTFEMMRDDLPGGTQVVLTSQDRTYEESTVTVVHGVEEAIEYLDDQDVETVYVLGGATVYEAFLPHLDELFLSRVPARPDGDATFPDFDRGEWTLVEEEPYDQFTLEHWRHASD